jgi:putative alpha-1,2-mannosidase
MREAGEWNEYVVHFVARFNRPFTNMGSWKGTTISQESNEISITDDMDIGAFLNFDVQENQEVLMLLIKMPEKFGMSY